MQFEIGSARNTPITPSEAMFGSINVNGTTIITFLNSEKNIACLDFPSATNVDCPQNCSVIIIKPAKYTRNGSIPVVKISASELNSPIKNDGNEITKIQNVNV
jgi:hypothetical protein